jgi:outer membrane autotransporter protein
VTISGGTVRGDVYAGNTAALDTLKATGNSVILAGGTVGGTVYGSNNDPDWATSGNDGDGSWQTDGNTLLASGGTTTVGGIQNFSSATINSGATVNVTQSVPLSDRNGGWEDNPLGSKTNWRQTRAGAATFNDLTNNGTLSFYNNSPDPYVARVKGTYSGNGRIGLDVRLGDPDYMAADSVMLDNVADGSRITVDINALPGSKPGPTPSGPWGYRLITIQKNAGGNFTIAPSEHGFGIYSYDIQPYNPTALEFMDHDIELTDAQAQEAGKVYSEAGGAVVLAAIALPDDTLLRNGLENAVSATAGLGFGISASLGYSTQRIDTGHGGWADLKGLSGMLTAAWNPQGSPWAVGAFAELFSGRFKTKGSAFTTNLDTYTIRSEGNLNNYGAGVFFQYRERLAEALASGAFTTWIPGAHFEATARAGYSIMDFDTVSINPSSFTQGGLYHGASLGGGYVLNPAEKISVDLYGHGIWISMRDREFDDSLGMRIEYKRANSLRLVAGLRAGYTATERVRPYAGLAVDYEALGKPQVRVDGYTMNRADMSGASALAELGVNIKAGDAWFVDLKGTGSVGKRTGAGCMAEVKYEF